MTDQFLQPLASNEPYIEPDETENDPADEAADEASDAEELDNTVDLSEDDEDGKASRRKTARIRVTPAIVRRVIERQSELAETSDDQRELLSAALGVKNDTIELTVATLTASRGSLSAVVELQEIANAASPFTAMVSALSLDRDVARRVWSLLIALDAAEGALPAKTELAGAKIAEAASGLTEDQRFGLDSIKELVG